MTFELHVVEGSGAILFRIGEVDRLEEKRRTIHGIYVPTFHERSSAGGDGTIRPQDNPGFQRILPLNLLPPLSQF
jgi:hypothetical protein